MGEQEMRPEKEERTTEVDFSTMILSSLTLCYQCGTCASSCPVAKITSRFNPREVIKLALMGEKREVVATDAVWFCCSCYNCQERCPQQVPIAYVIYALRNIAFKEQHNPRIYSEFASAFMNEGRIVSVSKFAEKKRSEYGLPPLQPVGVEALRKLLSAIRFCESQKIKETSL